MNTPTRIKNQERKEGNLTYFQRKCGEINRLRMRKRKCGLILL